MTHGRLAVSTAGGHFAVTAAVDNDANLLGLGEQRLVYPGAHLILFIKVGTGVGSSMIIDGEVLRGSGAAWPPPPAAGPWCVTFVDSAQRLTSLPPM
jgi:hypothetical protein